jgi:hypothetical protein
MSTMSAIVAHAAPITSTQIIAMRMARTFVERASMRPGSVTSIATRRIASTLPTTHPLPGEN